MLTLAKNITVPISRDEKIFGSLHFKLLNPQNGQTASNTDVVIDGHATRSDADGYVTLFIPLAEQKTTYSISAPIQLADTVIYAPCGPDDIIRLR